MPVLRRRSAPPGRRTRTPLGGGQSKTAATATEFLQLTARIEPANPAPGKTGRLVVQAAIPDGGHIEPHEPPDSFLFPTVLNIEPTAGLHVGEVTYPTPSDIQLAWSPIALRVLTGRIQFEVPFAIEAGASPGPRIVTANLRYQACIDGACRRRQDSGTLLRAPTPTSSW